MLLKLVDQEQVVVRTRAHHRALIPAAVNLLVVMTLMSFLLGYVARDTQPAFLQHYSHIASFIIWAAGLLALGMGTAKPLGQWLNRFTFLTSERIVQKNMIGTAHATVIPLALVTQSEVRRRPMQQASGAGDIAVVHGAFGQHQRTRLKDIPDADRFNTILAEELSAYRERLLARRASADTPHRGEQLGGHQTPDYSRGDVEGSSFGGGYAGI